MARDSEVVERTAVPVGSTVLLVVSGGPPATAVADAAVPAVAGMEQSDALNALQRLRLTTQISTQASASHPRGTVVAQWPRPGELTAYGSGAAIVVSSGASAPGVALVGVPTVIGQNELGAQALLQGVGLQSVVLRVANATVPSGIVIGQLPEERSVVPERPPRKRWWVIALVLALVLAVAGVLFLSRDTSQTATVAVPAVIGMKLSEAETALSDAGLTLGKVTETLSDTVKPGIVSDQDPAKDTKVESGSKVDLVVATAEVVEVPDVTGSTKDDALQTLARAQLRVAVTEAPSEDVQAGTVISQSPDAGQGVAIDAEVEIVVSTGPAEVKVAVPAVVGMKLSEAEAALSKAGLTVGKVTESASDTVKPGIVSDQDPAKSTKVKSGSKVDLVVAKAEVVEVPDVTGATKDDALQTLARAKLQVAVTEAPSEDVPAGTVISQSPDAGQGVAVDTEVGIIVSTGPAQVNAEVPDVAGQSVADATESLAAAELAAVPVDGYSATVPVGDVVVQSPRAGTSVAPGTPVALLVSIGPEPQGTATVPVPDVVGQSLEDATTALTDAGLKITAVAANGSGRPADEVLYQLPAAEEVAATDSQVVLIVSNGE